MQYLSSALYVLMLVLALKCAESLPKLTPRRFPPVAIGLWLLVAIPSLLQLTLFPGLYDALHRDSDLIRHHGQWWRPFTSLLVQDGGVAGTTFNLFTLAIVATAAVKAWGPKLTLGLFFGMAALFSIDTFLIDQPPGGGNSAATFRLATSMAGLALVALPGRRSRLLALGILADGVLTLALGDPHGEPMISGLVVGVLVALVHRSLQRRAGTADRRTGESVVVGEA